MNSTEKRLIRKAMRCLEDIPSGGVGIEGATRKEIRKVENQGSCFENDMNYHVTQSAWLYLNEALHAASGREEGT